MEGRHTKGERNLSMEAIKHALKELRKRHKLEEGAHAPAFLALSTPIIQQDSEWKEKTEKLESELQQCFKAQSRLSEQLVIEVSESRAAKASLQEKETFISQIQSQFDQLSSECSKFKAELEEKIKAINILASENSEIRSQLDAMTIKAKSAESENKMLIDRWMMQKMQDAERLNEANSLYEEMVTKLKSTTLEALARQQVDGIVRQSDEGAESYVESITPTSFHRKLTAHSGGCTSVIFGHNSTALITGGQDRTIKLWNPTTGSLTQTLHGSLGSVLDLAITHDNRTIIAATSSNNLYVFDATSGRVRHTLTGHAEKVYAVDASRVSARMAVSGAYDRTIKLWNLQNGYCTSTIMFPSNCNSVCLSADAASVCSGHADGSIRVWDVQSGRLVSEVSAHTLAVTSVSLSRSGNVVLSSGRDNVHNLFDFRSLEVCGTMKGGNGASNWSRSCMSPDEGYVASGSTDGSVLVWTVGKGEVVSRLKEHTGAVLACAWSGVGKPLASADRNGDVYTWV